MEEGVEFQRLGNLLVQIAGSEFSSEDERWVVAERRMMAMARNGGPTSMGHLLGLLRRADLPEKVADLVAKAISLCCGPCAAPPAVRSFIFSPSLSVQGIFPVAGYSAVGIGAYIAGMELLTPGCQIPSTSYYIKLTFLDLKFVSCGSSKGP